MKEKLFKLYLKRL